MLSRLVQFRSSLMQSKSISKRWRCMSSSSSDPTTRHDLINQPLTDSVFMVAGRDFGEYSVDGRHTYDDNDYCLIDKKGTASNYLAPWVTEDNHYKHKHLSNSCNGMMLVGIEESYFLFNPATKYFNKVLELDFNLCHSEFEQRLGLCYDSSIDDYRAILLLRHQSAYRTGRFVAQATLKGKQWTHIHFPFSLSCVDQGPFLKGRIHWIANRNLMNDDFQQHIVYYDPVSKTFEILPPPLPRRYWIEKDIMGLPPRKPGPEGIIKGLGVIDGCLWMTRQIDGVHGVEVLKMEEYGVAESWKTMFVLSDIKPYPFYGRFLTPLLKTENNGILFYKSWQDDYDENKNCTSSDSEILEYNPETKLCQTRFKTSRYEPDAVPFVSNLVDPPVEYDWDPVQHQQFRYYDCDWDRNRKHLYPF